MSTAQRMPPAPQPRLYQFSALDAVTLCLYGLLVFAVVGAGQLLVPFLRQITPTPAAASYAMNLLFYGPVCIFAFLAARKVVGRDLKVLATRPWFTVLMVPAAVIAMLIVSAVVVAAGGGVQTSENQAGLQSLAQQIPAWLMVPLMVVIGPFVEEYIFRHLLIGKLSRRINIWVCCVLSVALFAALHVVGRDELTLPVLLPYLAAGASLVFVYVWTGRNLMFSYFVHAAKNLLAVVFLYAIPPEFYEQLQQIPA